MSKRTMLFFSIDAIVLYLLGAVAIGLGAAVPCVGTMATAVSTSCTLQGIVPILVGTALLGLGVVLNLIALIDGLIKVAQNRKWVWFGLLLLLSPVTLLMYSIIDKEEAAPGVSY